MDVGITSCTSTRHNSQHLDCLVEMSSIVLVEIQSFAVQSADVVPRRQASDTIVIKHPPDVLIQSTFDWSTDVILISVNGNVNYEPQDLIHKEFVGCDSPGQQRHPINQGNIITSEIMQKITRLTPIALLLQYYQLLGVQ